MFKWVRKLIEKPHKLSKLEELFLQEFDKGVKEVDAYVGLYEVGELRVYAYLGLGTASVFHDSGYLGELPVEYKEMIRAFVKNKRVHEREEIIQKLLEQKE